MAEYLHFDRITIDDFSDTNIESLYDKGYVFGRRGKGIMDQTRSMRIDLSKFEMSSENRRIMRKTEDIILNAEDVPFANYSWEIGKLAKDFYDTKFGAGTFSANKVKEILTDAEKTNFSSLFVYSIAKPTQCIAFEKPQLPQSIGYSIIFETKDILHYSYPFYDLSTELKSLGMGMMIKAILHAKEQNKKYVYLGSAQRPSDTYKLQFKGLEWFDGNGWSGDLELLKNVLVESSDKQ